jgi:hypothetical protein
MGIGLAMLYFWGLGDFSKSVQIPDPTYEIPSEPYYPPKPIASLDITDPSFIGPPAPVSLGGTGPENPNQITPELPIPMTNPSGLEAGSMTIFNWGVQPSGPSTYRPLDLEIRNLLGGGL